MARRSVVIPVPASVSTGAAVDIDLFDRDAMVLINGIGTGTYQIQYSMKSGVWHQLGVDITADGAPQTLPNGALQVRVNVTAYTSGTPTCHVAGVER